ncbi:delta-60 repeat domain-containing protein, partial [Streptomyces sp. NPDC051555]|uniref:delta-60 repeat domain-containing protein n=1 Tax=Streptomyces sp. NPDC051555 TaxID=3365657 RepID=UPI003796A4F1
NAGKTTTHFADTPDQTNDQINSLALQPDGKILAGGTSSTTRSTVFAIARFAPDGSMDEGFGHGGRTTTDFGNSYDRANSLVLGPDGTIIAAGYTSATRTTAFAVARYMADGRADPAFGTGGKLTTLSGAHSYAIQAALHPDGGLVVAGFTYGTDHMAFAVARYALPGAACDRRREAVPDPRGAGGTQKTPGTSYGCGGDNRDRMRGPVLPLGKVLGELSPLRGL